MLWETPPPATFCGRALASLGCIIMLLSLLLPLPLLGASPPLVLLLRGTRCCGLEAFEEEDGDAEEEEEEEADKEEEEEDEANEKKLDGKEALSFRGGGVGDGNGDDGPPLPGLKLLLLLALTLLLPKRCNLAWCGECVAEAAAKDGRPNALKDEGEDLCSAACRRASSIRMERINICSGASSRSSIKSNSNAQKIKCLKQLFKWLIAPALSISVTCVK